MTPPNLSPSELERLIELASAYREHRISDADVAELDMMLSESPAAMDAFVELGMLVADLSQTPAFRLSGNEANSDPSDFNQPNRSHLPKVLIAMAACLVLAVGSWAWISNKPAPSFAKLESDSNCIWRESAPIVNRIQRIGVGHFRLSEGIASLRFDNGATVDLEGPSHLEVIGKDRCQLHAGKLVVTVENDFKGFTVDTPNGQFVDQGTSFGVTVEDDGASVVEVFDGLVDVKHYTSGEERRLTEDASVRLLAKEMVDEADYAIPTNAEKSADVQIATTTSQGADCSLRRDHRHRVKRNPLLAVRTHRTKLNRFDKRTCLRFDLKDLTTADTTKAKLQLTAAPSGKGYASISTDVVIAVYGIVDDSLDQWEADSLLWENLPGNIENASDSSKPRLLGRFTIPKGQQTGNFSIEGTELTEFIKSDSNQLLSIVLISESESRKGMILNTFASSYHESLRPPTLHLWFEQ